MESWDEPAPGAEPRKTAVSKGEQFASGAVTPQFQAEARRYQMRRLRLGLASSGLELGVTALLFAAAPRGSWPWGEGSLFLAGAAYFALLILLRQAVSLPLDYLAGFRLAHEVGLSNETLGGWAVDRVKGFLLLLLAATAFGLVSMPSSDAFIFGNVTLVGTYGAFRMLDGSIFNRRCIIVIFPARTRL